MILLILLSSSLSFFTVIIIIIIVILVSPSLIFLVIVANIFLIFCRSDDPSSGNSVVDKIDIFRPDRVFKVMYLCFLY